MKVYSIYLFKKMNPGVGELCSAKDLSDFGYFQKGRFVCEGRGRGLPRKCSGTPAGHTGGCAARHAAPRRGRPEGVAASRVFAVRPAWDMLCALRRPAADVC